MTGKSQFGKNRVCGVVAAETARAMISQVRSGLRKTRTLELRVDYLRDANERAAFLSWLRRQRPRAEFIATCRRKEGGGLFGGNREEQIEILAEAARSGCAWCDVEIETAKHMNHRDLAQAVSPARLLISHHDFRATPRGLANVARRLKSCGADAIKIAAMCHSVSDSLRICEFAKTRRDAIAIPMGEAGLAGRVLALRMGSNLAYAAVEQSTAPGQLSLDAMTDLYGAERFTQPHPGVWSDRRSNRAFAVASAAQHRVSRTEI